MENGTIVLDQKWMTFSPEVVNLMARNNITSDRIWLELSEGCREISYNGRFQFIFYGRLFYLVRNSYGGPEVRVERG